MFIKSFHFALPWLLLASGLAAFTIGTFGNFESNTKTYITGLGSSVLASGVFAVILKSFQFIGIFKSELTNIIFEPKFLANRNDLPEYWEKVTKELFKNKFPRINQKITQDVKNIYLPTDSVQYYNNCNHYIEIKLIDPDEEIVEVTQTSRFIVIPVEPKSKFGHYFVNNISCGDKREQVSFELLSFKVNEASQHLNVENSYENGCLVSKYEVSLSGKEEYHIEMEIKKRYSLKQDNIIAQANTVMRHNFTVNFQLEGVKLAFRELGTLNKFKTNKQNEKLLVKEYNGIIYPKQGFMAIITKK